jgi:hypothetical protein
MGLLDEAIREHLELKRRRGGDPGAIAREEREALAPVFGDEHAGVDENGGHAEQGGPDAAGFEPAPGMGAPVEDHHHGDERLADLSPMGQETAELDMQAVMEEDPDAADGASPVGPTLDGPVPAAYRGEIPKEEPLEWEVAHERDAGVEPEPEDSPGQGRLSFE